MSKRELLFDPSLVYLAVRIRSYYLSGICKQNDCFRQQSHIFREPKYSPLINEKFTPGIILIFNSRIAIACHLNLLYCRRLALHMGNPSSSRKVRVSLSFFTSIAVMVGIGESVKRSPFISKTSPGSKLKFCPSM